MLVFPMHVGMAGALKTTATRKQNLGKNEIVSIYRGKKRKCTHIIEVPKYHPNVSVTIYAVFLVILVPIKD